MNMKEQGIQISLAAVISWVPLIPIFWFLVKPILIQSVGEAVASDIQHQVEEGVRPINAAFKVLLGQQILNLKKDIATLEFRRDNPPTNDWTAEDQLRLVGMESELKSLEEAKEEL